MDWYQALSPSKKLLVDNVPEEIKELWAWCGSHAGKKIPVMPGQPETYARVDDPQTWSTFESVITSALPRVGFVLTDHDPYVIVDLDNTDDDFSFEILKKFKKTYIEKSISGNGYHIVCKGTVPGNLKTKKVEIYCQKRYIIFTGNVVRKNPIIDQTEILNQLFLEIGQEKKEEEVELKETAPTQTDQEILETALRASNSEKFEDLWNGKIENYPSQSEADFALINLLAFYTASNSQVARLFHASALGKRKKATLSYINRALRKIRKPDVQVDFPQAGSEPEIEDAPPPEPLEKILEKYPLTYPPYLIGDIAKFIFDSLFRPVKEVAILGSIALFAALCGRAYNVSGTGLNLYLILLGATGIGKEGLKDGIELIITKLEKTFGKKDEAKKVQEFIGPAVFASGQAMLRCLKKNQCFVSILGEFGLTLQRMCAPSANASEIMLRRVLLDLYAKSGNEQILRPFVYSDEQRNVEPVDAPAVSIVGESTQETFFEGLDSSHILEGLIPRFSIVEYMGDRPPQNKEAFRNRKKKLPAKMAKIALAVIRHKTHNEKIKIVGTDAEAEKLLDNFNVEVDQKINGSSHDVERQLWNRAHLKTLKISALLAIGKNYRKPEITVVEANWAKNFICREVEITSYRFRSGAAGSGNAKQSQELKRTIKAYYALSLKKRAEQATVPKALCVDNHKNKFPYSYVRKRIMSLKCFQNDKNGAIFALTKMLKSFEDADIIQKSEKFDKIKTEIYQKGSLWHS